MKTLGKVLLLLMLTVLGCGQQLVEYALTPPTVTSTLPARNATKVAVDSNIVANFSEPMAPATINTNTFTVAQDGASPLAGTVTYSGTAATFSPASPLAASTVFTATVDVGAQNKVGTGLAAKYSWTFTTGAMTAVTPPTVISTSPPDKATGVVVGTAISATFSEPMNPATITTSTFLVTQGATPVAGVVTFNGVVATFAPTSALATSSLFTGTITTGAKDLAGNALSTSYIWHFTTGAGGGTTPPTVVLTVPATNATSVAVGAKLTALFDEVMDPATLTGTTFTVTQGGMQVAGAVTSVGATATFAPTASLTSSTMYTATITTGAKDLFGNALAANYVWTFTTAAAPDLSPPVVSFTEPANMATGVSDNTVVSAAFDKAIDPTTILPTTFFVYEGPVPIPGTLTYAGTTATFKPSSPLASDAVYTATITTGVKATNGVALAADYVWTFTTAGPPAVIATNPINNAQGVALDAPVTATFSEPMDPLSITALTFTVNQGAVAIPGMVTYLGTTATFTPSGNYPMNATLTATITTGAKDLAQSPIAQNYVWSFKTGAQVGLAGINLGAASSYAILAFNTVTNVNNPGTVVTGDLGISPGMALVGFPPGQVVGTEHLGDPPAAAAKLALLAAYNDAVSRLLPAVLPGDMSGLTFTPGLYKVATSVMLSAGNCTLDAQGDSSAVFIFQIGSTLTTNPGTQIVLAGAAKATNIYWAVGTSATLGTNSKFKGTILAASAITMKTGASIEGRLLAQAAAVSLDTNLITVPAP